MSRDWKPEARLTARVLEAVSSKSEKRFRIVMWSAVGAWVALATYALLLS